MKKMIVVCFSIIIEFLSCALCYATISPVEGSSNYLDTDMDALPPADCVDIEFIFARGSGAEYKASDMWLKYKSEMTKLSKKLGYSYRITDVDYPAVSVDNSLSNAVGAYMSAGKYYEFGKSVRAGIKWTKEYYSRVSKTCSNTQWVLTGYSQGAMVVTDAVKSFRHSDVIYIALFADPQLYLPEGEGLFPDACSGKNLSEYRIFVPACRTREGSLKARSPYQFGELSGKYGLWCEKNDFVCGSTNVPWNVSGHTKYVGKIIQLTNILKKRLYRDECAILSVPHSATLATIEDGLVDEEVVAILPTDEYFVRVNELVSFDGRSSFSVDGEIARYEWSFNDDYSMSGYEGVMSRSFNVIGDYSVDLKVIDDSGASARTVAIIHVVSDNYSEDGGIIAPNVLSYIDDNGLVIEWDGYDVARCLLVRIDNYDLGCADGSRNKVTITDIEPDDYNKVSVAWVADDLSLGEFKDVTVSNSLIVGDNKDLMYPDTNVSFEDGILPSVLIAGCLFLIRRIMK